MHSQSAYHLAPRHNLHPMHDNKVFISTWSQALPYSPLRIALKTLGEIAVEELCTTMPAPNLRYSPGN